MPMTLDLSDVKTELEPIPPGVYDATVSEVTLETSKAGNPYLKWKFSVEPNEDIGFDGVTPAYYNTSLLDQSLWVLKRTLKALGFKDNELGEINVDDLLLDLPGLECTLEIETSFYEGEERSSVADIYPAGTVVDSVTDEDMDIF